MADVRTNLIKRIESAVGDKTEMKSLTANEQTFRDGLPAIKLSDEEMEMLNGGNAFMDWLMKGEWWWNQ